MGRVLRDQLGMKVKALDLLLTSGDEDTSRWLHELSNQKIHSHVQVITRIQRGLGHLIDAA